MSVKIVLHSGRTFIKDFTMKLSELAEKTFATIENGTSDLEVTAAAGIDIAVSGDITFLANPKYTPQIAITKASAIFLNEGVKAGRDDIAILRATDAYLAYTRALRLFHPESKVRPGIHMTAVVDQTAIIADGVEIGANVVVGVGCRIESGVKIFPNATLYENVSVGENSVIHSGVSVRENCEIGRNCIVHNNTTIGSDVLDMQRRGQTLAKDPADGPRCA